MRTELVIAATLSLLGTLVVSVSACSSSSAPSTEGSVGANDPRCAPNCAIDDGTVPGSSGGTSGGPTTAANGADGGPTGPDCGGSSAKRCKEGEGCLVDSDCEVACGYTKKCVGAPSCKPHLGGDTCGSGEVGEGAAKHESCCRSLKVPAFTDAAHPGKTVYLDKYEITAGRVRAWIEQTASQNGGKPNVKSWVASHRPAMWDVAWEEFLPTDVDGGTLTIGRRLLGDPRPEDAGNNGPPGPGVILPPATDQLRRMGTDYQFGSELYVDLHGNNCATYPGSYGFPTYYYPPDILTRDGQLARANGVTVSGQPIAAKDLLDVKSMNCVTNAMLAAFCAWDGGQLATDEVLDFVTDSPASLANVSGCGTQRDDHGKLLNNDLTGTVQTGGRCPDVTSVNATFDAGDALPVLNSPLNTHQYSYPATGNPAHDKSWQVAAPGRVTADAVRINAADEPWMDLTGNLNEAALDVSGAPFTGKFALKYRGVGYGSSRSDLNVSTIQGESIKRVQRPEAKAAYTGGRCMRFR